MQYRVVCVSQVTAAGGEAIGELVAARLGFRYVDDEVITLAADHAGLDPAIVGEAEHHKTLLTRLTEALFATPEEVASYFTPRDRRRYEDHVSASARPPHERLRRLIQDAIVEIAARGSAVIVAHAASMALAGTSDVLRVHVTASLKTRVARLWLPNKLISEDEYAKTIAESDRQRQKYLERFYDVREETPNLYDLVINTDALAIERAVATVVTAARG